MHTKKLCGAAAAVALAAVGAGALTGRYAVEHPSSLPGRCAVTARSVVAAEVGTLHACEGSAELAFRGLHGFLSKPAPHGGCENHAAPAPEEVCPDAPDLPEAPAALVEMRPAVLPGAVVIDDEVVVPLRRMPTVRDDVGVLPLPGTLEESEPEEAPMPRVEDDTVPMPRAEDGDCDTDCCHPKQGTKGGAVPTGPDEPSLPAGPDAGPAPQRHHPAPAKIKGKDAPAGNEECEPILERLTPETGEAPKHRDVDTMEVRPSDLRFRDFGGRF